VLNEVITALKTSNLFGSRVYEVTAPYTTALPYAQVYLLGAIDIEGDGKGMNILKGVVVVDVFTKQNTDFYIQGVQNALLSLNNYIALRYARVFAESDGVFHIVMEYNII
jgi:hypothetical protein